MSGGTDRLPQEHTPLLAPARDQYIENSLDTSPRYQDEDSEDEIDANETDLLLAKTVSASGAAGLAPEAIESSMLRGRQRRPSNALSESIDEHRVPSASRHRAHHGDDAEAATRRPSTLRHQRTFLIDTNNRQFWTIFLTIMSCYFLACFDGTIMASSHPVITSYFHSSNSASWLSTSFLLTSTAIQPMVGRLSDTIGRKTPYIVTTTIFFAATAWCALANSMETFVAARAVCGLGAGGMLSLASIIISDLVDIERRGTYQSIVNVVYGLASASGAALGGLMADTMGWRWEFGIQVPPLLICLFVASFSIPTDLGLQGKRESFVEAARAFDFRGSLLLTLSTTFLILGLNLGGNLLPWSHPFVISSLIVFSVCFPAFLFVESRAMRPIMPLVLLHSSPRSNIIFSNFIAALILNAVLFNIPLYFQAVLLTSATDSGLRLVVSQVTAAVGGTATGFLISYTKRLKWPLVLGSCLTLTGTIVLSLMQRGWPAWTYLLCLVPSAMGQGFQFPGAFIAVLAASEQTEQAVVTSTLTLWRSLGSVLGVASSSLILQNALLLYLRMYVTEDGHGEGWKDAVIERVRESVEAVAELDGLVKEQVVLSYEASVRLTFLCCVGFAAINVGMNLPVKLPRLGGRR